MAKKLCLPPAYEEINELFMYVTHQVDSRCTPLTPGYWVSIIFDVIDEGVGFESGGMKKVRRLFCEGMDALAERVQYTDVVGIWGQTDLHNVLLRRVGFDVGYVPLCYGRIAYMSVERFLEKPWYTKQGRQR